MRREIPPDLFKTFFKHSVICLSDTKLFWVYNGTRKKLNNDVY